QVFAIHEKGQNGVRNSSDANLQHRAILNQAGHVFRNGDVSLGDLGFPRFTQWTGAFHNRMELTDMNKAVPVGAWHLIIDVGDYIAGTIGSSQRSVHAQAKAAK